MQGKRFNVRVYGLMLEQGKLLVAEQLYKNTLLRKFPGGGLQFGEGLVDALKREFIEELNLEIEIINHYYTTDFFVQSAFSESDQVISVFYRVKPVNGNIPELKPYGGLPSSDNEEVFLWIPVSEIMRTEFTFPVEKKVAELIYKDFTEGII